MKKNKPFIIYAYDYHPGIGGIKVTHKLCHLINELGYECYLFPIEFRDEFIINSAYNTPLITENFLKDLDDAIVIYADGVRENPLNAKNIVRWILGPPTNHMKFYNSNELVYWFMDFYYEEYLGQRDNKLFICEFHDDIFYNKNLERKGSSYCIRKCADPKFVHPANSIFIPYHAAGDLLNIADLFNKTEIFYCYDDHTFLYTQAAICGCLSVVIPEPHVSKEQWMSGSRLHRYGVAYGLDDIQRAKETLPLLLEEIENIKSETKDQVISFINNCQIHFK